MEPVIAERFFFERWGRMKWLVCACPIRIGISWLVVHLVPGGHCLLPTKPNAVGDLSVAHQHERLTPSLKSAPGLKRTARLLGTTTDSPVLGFLALRGGRWLDVNDPKPRISIRAPLAKAMVNALTMASTLACASRTCSCAKRSASSSTNCDRFMERIVGFSVSFFRNRSCPEAQDYLDAKSDGNAVCLRLRWY